MSPALSRRDCLQLLAASGLISVLPVATGYAKTVSQAFVVSGNTVAGNAFSQSVADRLTTISLHISHNNYASLMSFSQLPENALLIGLVSDAEMVLIDAMLRERGRMTTSVARIKHLQMSIKNISQLAEATILAALTTDVEALEVSPQNREVTA